MRGWQGRSKKDANASFCRYLSEVYRWWVTALERFLPVTKDCNPQPKADIFRLASQCWRCFIMLVWGSKWMVIAHWPLLAQAV